MKNLILIGGLLFVCAGSLQATSSPHDDYQESLSAKKYTASDLMYNASEPVMEYTICNPYSGLDNVAVLVEPVVLALAGSDGVTEPVKRTYRYVFIRRFDWRCQKK